METLIFKNTTEKKLQSLLAYAKKLGLEVIRNEITEYKEDSNLAKIIKEEKTGKQVSRNTIFKNLTK